MPHFTYPIALGGLIALPLLVGIYLLRNRYRRQAVSSLLLWLDPREARTGGPRIDRLQTPLLFFLELLLLLLVILAAAGPHLPLSQGGRPLVVILDDSFSMLAGEPDSPRAAAVKALEEELRRIGRSSIRFVLAGDKPVLLGEATDSPAAALRTLQEWRCRSASAAISEAVTLASEVGGEVAALLVITDHAPKDAIETGRLQWRAFGQKRDNWAFVNAVRTQRDGTDRCLLEIANLSDRERSTTLTIETDGNMERRSLKLKPNEVHRRTFQLKEGAGLLRAHLDDDELAIDNQVSLLPAPIRKVRVQLSLADSVLRTQAEKALRATRSMELTSDRPALVVTDAAAPPELTGDTWALHLTGGEEKAAYDGPFVLDRAHPLTEGLSLQGVMWAPGTKGELPGSPVVLAGNVALLTDTEDSAGRHLLRLRLRHDISNLLESPSWPVLLANLVQWRGGFLPGLGRSSIRLGEEVILTLTNTSDEVRLIAPDKAERRLNVQEGRVVARGEQVGIYEIRQGDDKYPFAVNALSGEESDLRNADSGTWGDWLDDAALRLDYRSIGWLLVVIALGVAVIHLLLVARLKRSTQP
jgi:hypothetical protein